MQQNCRFGLKRIHESSLSMIERFKRIATILKRIRSIIIFCAAFSSCMMLLSVFQSPWLSGEFWLIPSLIAFCWFLVLFSFGELFASVPDLSAKQTSWGRRFMNSIHRTWYRILGTTLIIILIALILLSYQLLRQWYLR